jgi:hypothetical protein
VPIIKSAGVLHFGSELRVVDTLSGKTRAKVVKTDAGNAEKLKP